LIEPKDGPALEALIAASPDAGRIGFTNDYQVDPLELYRALATDFRAVVAERGERLVGAVFGDFSRAQLNGAEREAVYISNLRVHPDFRRQGVARELWRWGLRYVEDVLGPGAVPYAAILAGNVSRGLAREVGFVPSEPVRGGVVPMRRRPPSERRDLEVRAATENDLPAIAEGMNHFHREHNLWTPVTASTLRAFLELGVAGITPNQLYVVTKAGQTVGGLSVSDLTGLVRMRISRAPRLTRMIGSWLGILPRSGILRALTVRRIFFADGELAAGRHLWQQLRYRLRKRGDCLGIAYDPRSPVAKLFQLPPWLPMFEACYLVRADSLETERPTYCIAGA